MGTQAAVLRELPAAVRVGPSLAASLRIQTVVAAVEEAAKDVRLVVTLTAQIQNTAHNLPVAENRLQWYLYYFQESISIVNLYILDIILLIAGQVTHLNQRFFCYGHCSALDTMSCPSACKPQ